MTWRFFCTNLLPSPPPPPMLFSNVERCLARRVDTNFPSLILYLYYYLSTMNALARTAVRAVLPRYEITFAISFGLTCFRHFWGIFWRNDNAIMQPLGFIHHLRFYNSGWYIGPIIWTEQLLSVSEKWM